MDRRHRLEHYDEYVEEEHASSEYPPVYTDSTSYIPSYSSGQHDTQVHGLSSYQQVATSPWLPIDSSYQSADTPSLTTGWGNAPHLQDPFGAPTAPPRTSRSNAASSGAGYATGRTTSWGTGDLDQGFTRGFTGNENQNAYGYEYTQTQSSSGSNRRRVPASAPSNTSQSHRRAGTRSGGNRASTSASGQGYIGEEFFSADTTSQQQDFDPSLTDFSAAGSQYDFAFHPSNSSGTGTGRAAPLMTTGQQTWDSSSLSLSTGALDPFTTAAGSSSQAANTAQYEYTDDGSSDTDGGFVDPSSSLAGDQTATSSRQQSLSPLPSSSKASGKQRASASSSKQDAEPMALRCTFEGCSSKVVFTRHCDLAKHYRQHFRKYACRVEGCGPSAGFATKKDRARHERTHNPSILCEHCGRKFSRQDNLRDHIRRRH